MHSCFHVSVPWVVKLKSDGFSLPLGSLMLGSRSSSKNECAQASKGVRRAVGVYSSRREHRAMASGGVRGRNTWRDTKIGHHYSYEVYSCVSTLQNHLFCCYLHSLVQSGWTFLYICCIYIYMYFFKKNCPGCCSWTSCAVTQSSHSRAPESRQEALLVRGDAVATAGVGPLRGRQLDRMSLRGFPSVLVSQRLQAHAKRRTWRRESQTESKIESVGSTLCCFRYETQTNFFSSWQICKLIFLVHISAIVLLTEPFQVKCTV